MEETPVLKIERVEPSAKHLPRKEAARVADRLAGKHGFSRGRALVSLEQPEHEFLVSFESAEQVMLFADHRVRVYGHELGDYVVCTVWRGDELLYDMLAMLPQGALWESFAGLAVERWFTTAPPSETSDVKAFFVPGAGAGKTISAALPGRRNGAV